MGSEIYRAFPSSPRDWIASSFCIGKGGGPWHLSSISLGPAAVQGDGAVLLAASYLSQ